MRTIPPALAEHLAGEATTLAHAFVVRLTDGAIFGFTDHDRELTVDGVACRPDSGFDGSAATRHAGFAVGEEEIAGVLSAEAISQSDLASGRWDGATVDVYCLNWQEPTAVIKLRTGRLGEVVQRDGAFRAELRGPAYALGQTRGRLYGRFCDAAFGDARCGINVRTWTRSASIAAGSELRSLCLAGLDDVAAGWLDRGTCHFAAGALAGVTARIEHHGRDGATARLALRHPLSAKPEVGAAVTVTAGCDKQFATCCSRFRNADNFRGFPHMPGRDFIFSFASGDSGTGVLF